jgi:hypothetical protein
MPRTYDPIPGRPRSSAGFVQHGKYAYWVGGHLGQYHYYDRGHFSREAHRLDLETGEWKRIFDFPVPAQGFRMAALDNSLYAFGGFVYEGDTEWPVRSQSAVRRYDIAADKWETVAELQLPRSSNVVGVVNDIAYLIGGWNGMVKENPHDESLPWTSMPGTFHATIELFDLSQQKTIDVIPLGVSPRRAFAAITSGTDITVACGLGPFGPSDLKSEVMTFSTSTKQWTTLFNTPKGLFSPGLVWPLHAPLVVGGLFLTADYSQYEEYSGIATLDPHAGGGWLTKTHLSSTRTFAECAIYGDDVIVFGGHSGLWPTSNVESFDKSFPPSNTAALEHWRSVGKSHRG